MIEKVITENGIYNPADDSTDAYSHVTVSVPYAGTIVTKEISENGTYNASDDLADGYSGVTIDVHIEAEYGEIEVSENRTYDAYDEGLDGYTDVFVSIPASNIGHASFTDNGTYYAASLGFIGLSVVEVSVPTFDLLQEITISTIGTYNASDMNKDAFANVFVSVPDFYSNYRYITNDHRESNFTIDCGSALTIKSNAFRGASFYSLSIVTVSKINMSAFQYCDNLGFVEIYQQDHNISIGDKAFFLCTKLSSVYIRNNSNIASIIQFGSSVFDETPMDDDAETVSSHNGTIYVPASQYTKYINASNLRSYSAHISSYY